VRYGLLRLAAEVGISDEGCRALRSIRQDDAKGWEMPLQCLRDRRTYLIDAASGGRQVPPLVAAGPAMRSVASVPLCAGETPLGSLVLVALAPRALSEHDLQQLAGPLDEVVRMIETARRPRAAAPAPAPKPSGVLAEPGLGGEVTAGPPERARLESARRATDRAELLAAAEAEVESARTALADAEARSVALGRRARAEIERLELAERDGRAERERMETELTEIRARFDELAERGSALEGEIGVLRETVATLRGEVQTLAAERDRLRGALAELQAEPDPVVADDAPGTAAAEPTPFESPPAPAAPPRPAAQPPSAVRPRADGARRLVVVLDVDPVWEGAAIDGTEVTVVKPGSDVAAWLAGATPTRLVVNLAAPGALAAMGALRAAGVSGRFWGCLTSPASDKALPLGMIEPATRPLDPDAILPVLGGYATRGTRVVTAGADGDAFMSLRHALTRQGLSVSMAWDAKQAVDLLDAVRPEVVVLDLELPPRNGYELVVRLAGAIPVPSVVLVYGDGDDTAAGFAAALTRGAAASGLVPRDRLLADVLGHSEAPPAERPKVYALPQGR